MQDQLFDVQSKHSLPSCRSQILYKWNYALYNVNFLIVILKGIYIDVITSKNWVKGIWNLSVLFLATIHEYMYFLKRLKKFTITFSTYYPPDITQVNLFVSSVCFPVLSYYTF